MNYFVAAATLLMLAVTPAQAAPEKERISTDVTKAISGKYQLDSSHAMVYFKVSHNGFSNFMGGFSAMQGTLDFDNKAPERSKLTINIDPKSVTTNSLRLNNELQGERFFHSSRYPLIIFESTQIKKTGPNKGTVTGTLNLRGATQPVTLDVTFNGSGKSSFSNRQTLGFSATGKVERSVHGVNGLLPMIGDDVYLIIEVQFNKI